MTRVVIAGGGIAGLEGLIALREQLGPGPEIHLLEANLDLVERQRSVAEPFDGAPARHFDLQRIADDHGATLHPDQLGTVDTDQRVVHTVRGEAMAYDALLIAVGARPDVAIPGALTFRGPRDVTAYRKLLGAVETGRVRSVAFAVPSGIAWTLPLYELALLTAGRLREAGRTDVELVVVTPERQPLGVFGPALAARVAALLAHHGIRVRSETTPVKVGVGGLVVTEGEPVRADWVVALPRLGGPWIGGLPHDEDGFVPTDAHGAVCGVYRVWAAGDGTAFPIKQGGIAAQQADAAAGAIAVALGAAAFAEPFVARLRGLLMEPHGERLLDDGSQSPDDEEPWWPAGKVAARHLSPYLARNDPAAADVSADAEGAIDVQELLLALASDHEATDPRLALRCLDAAAQLPGALPAEAARQRRELSASSFDDAAPPVRAVHPAAR